MDESESNFGTDFVTEFCGQERKLSRYQHRRQEARERRRLAALAALCQSAMPTASQHDAEAASGLITEIPTPDGTTQR